MDAYLQLSSEDRRIYCEQAELKLGFPAATIEKDFWVCWTLRELFGLEVWGPAFTFKGGTSLSKAWKLITRFSEDIDIVIDRSFLGFGPERNPEEGDSNKEVRRKLESLKTECSQRIQNELLAHLGERFKKILPHGLKWTLEMASIEEDPDLQSILFTYPTVFPDGVGYLRRVVKMEFGARSDHEPSASAPILPSLAEAFPEYITNATFEIKTLAPERTFLEKSMLVHEEAFRDPAKTRKKGMSRHYFDLWSMINHGVGARASQDTNLFEQIAEHRKIYFKWSWVDYETMKIGAMRLVPPGEHLDYWRQDYKAMHAEMFIGTVPSFDEMMKVVAAFEGQWNAGARI